MIAKLFLLALGASSASSFIVGAKAPLPHAGSVTTMKASVFDFTVKDVDGNDYPLSKLSDKKALLFVNVASK